jgi:hypothetical protein
MLQTPSPPEVLAAAAVRGESETVNFKDVDGQTEIRLSGQAGDASAAPAVVPLHDAAGRCNSRLFQRNRRNN